MTKNLFLATAAVGVMAFAGTASAHTLSFRAAALPTTDIDAGNANIVPNLDPTTTDMVKYGRSLVGLYLIANELNPANLTGATLALQDVLSSGAIPSGNNLYTLTLTNATFSSAVASGAVTGANCTVAPSSGGAIGGNTVTFIVSSSGGGNCTGFNVDLPVVPTATGVVTITANLRTDNEVPIDGGTATFDAIYPIDAFQPIYNAAFNVNGAGVDTTTTVGSLPPYTTLVGDGNLGSVAIYVDTRANDDVFGGLPVDATDVTAATVTVTGDFDAFNAATTNATLEATPATSAITATTATYASVQGLITTSLANRSTATATASNLVVTADGAAIDSSTYTGSIAYTLTPADFSAQTAATGSFESIERDGANFIAPWVGGSQAQSQSVIRLSSTGIASGAVFLTLTNGYTSGNVAMADPAVCSVGPVPAAGDLVIGQPRLLACFGNFLRADLLVSVEAAPATITAKMRNITPNSTGGTFETTLGRYSGSVFAGAAQ